MSAEIFTLFIILVAVIIFLVFEWVPLEVLAMLVMGTLAVTGIVTPKEALAGFSNPAVITIWAVFILSGGLTRTGIANILLGQEPDFLVLTEKAQEPLREERAKVALAIMIAVLIPVIMNWLPIYIAVVIGAAAMVLTRCLTMEEAYRYIEWKAVFLIAGMLPLGTALDKSGAAGLLAEGVAGFLGPFGPHAVLFGLLAITFIATSIIPTAALVVLMVPIALQTAAGMGISPHALMMGVAMAASSSFTSPISHPANVLVMGPGGYRFIDYVKVGLPLTLVVLLVLMAVLPIFWPL